MQNKLKSINSIEEVVEKINLEDIEKVLSKFGIGSEVDINIGTIAIPTINTSKAIKKGLEHLPKEKLNELLQAIKNLEPATIEQLKGKSLMQIVKDVDNYPIKDAQKETLKKIFGFTNKTIDEIRKDIIPTTAIKNTASDIMKSQPVMIFSSAINSKTLINYLKKLVTNMPEEKLANFNSKLDDLCMGMGNAIELGTVSKAEILDSINKLEKILNNLPEEEIKKITETYAKMISEDPKKFIYLITKEPGKLMATMNTPVLQNTMMTLGIGTAAGTIGLTYGIASLLAKLQKDAGRYGVMQAMNELEDYRYYADGETVQAEKKQTGISTQKMNNKKVEQIKGDYFKQFVANKKNSSK